MSFEASEKTLEEQIAEVQNFDELYAVLRQVGSLKGSQKEYSAEELIKDIVLMRSTMESVIPATREKLFGVDRPPILQIITGTGGLRDKVKVLLEEEFLQRQKTQG